MLLWECDNDDKNANNDDDEDEDDDEDDDDDDDDDNDSNSFERMMELWRRAWWEGTGGTTHRSVSYRLALQRPEASVFAIRMGQTADFGPTGAGVSSRSRRDHGACRRGNGTPQHCARCWLRYL
jgi:hypothetical protein